MQLVIGNKNYSSWSMRPWVLMTHFGMAFDEVKLRFDFTPDSDFYRALRAFTPTGRVPVLVDDGFAVWDTLAIVEYLAERYPELPIWPRDAQGRARARSLCAEMHSGFGALRSACPQNLAAHLPQVGARLLREQPGLVQDLQRIDAMWREQIALSAGPFLFAEFGAVDAFYAPVAGRIRTYGLPVSPEAAAYGERLLAAPGVAEWVADALAEKDFLDFEEPYRSTAD